LGARAAPIARAVHPVVPCVESKTISARIGQMVRLSIRPRTVLEAKRLVPRSAVGHLPTEVGHGDEPVRPQGCVSRPTLGPSSIDSRQNGSASPRHARGTVCLGTRIPRRRVSGLCPGFGVRVGIGWLIRERQEL
jgi:hypothetical protein